MTIKEARELVSNRLLWPLVRDFLWDFAPLIHASWLDGLPTSDFGHDFAKSEVRSPKASSRVKRYILDSLGVKPCFHAFPADDGSRILLLDGATLESVAKWLGALACADAMRRVTDGATVRELKAALPGVYPEVFGYTAYFKGMEETCGFVVRWLDGAEVDVKLNGDLVVNVGYLLLNKAVSHLPEPLLNRLRLKQPARPAARLPDHLTTKTQNLQLLLKLRFPEAYKLCCS